jgi:hypothetical protein
MKERFNNAWHALCHNANAMVNACRFLPRRTRGELFLSGLLSLGIIALLLVPSPGQALRFGSSAPRLFTLTEGDYLNPLLSCARAVTILNCAAESIASFAGYDDFSSRLAINNTIQMVKVTRYRGNLLSLLNTRFELIEPANSSAPCIYISEAFWERAFARRADVIGMQLRFMDATYRISGVTRSSNGLLADTEIWLPVSRRGPYGSMHCMRILGMLHGGADWATAQDQLAKCFDEFLKDQPYNAVPGAKLVPLETSIYFGEAPPAMMTEVNGGPREMEETS